MSTERRHPSKREPLPIRIDGRLWKKIAYHMYECECGYSLIARNAGRYNPDAGSMVTHPELFPDADFTSHECDVERVRSVHNE